MTVPEAEMQLTPSCRQFRSQRSVYQYAVGYTEDGVSFHGGLCEREDDSGVIIDVTFDGDSREREDDSIDVSFQGGLREKQVWKVLRRAKKDGRALYDGSPDCAFRVILRRLWALLRLLPHNQQLLTADYATVDVVYDESDAECEEPDGDEDGSVTSGAQSDRSVRQLAKESRFLMLHRPDMNWCTWEFTVYKRV